MIGFVLLCMAVGAVFTIIGFLALDGFAQFKERTVDDIPELIRPQNPEIDLQLFDPAVDEELRRRRVSINFRRKQRIRLDLVSERYRCKHYHVRLLLQWANTEWSDLRRLHTMDEYTLEALANLQLARELGRRFLLLSALMRIRLWLMRIFLRLDKFLLLPTPEIAPLRRLGRIDMLKLYEEFKVAMAEFARTYGDDEAEQIKTL